VTTPTLSPLATVLLEREAADVLRYHTQRTLRQQSIGAHSFGVMQLVLAADPECRKEVLVAAMRHDYAELSTGDVPAPAKRASAALQGALDDLERAHPHLAPHPGPFTSRELRILKWADTMELVLWCIEGFHYSKQINQLISTGCIAHQALRTVTQKRPQAALPGMASSTVPTLSATTAVTAAVGALLGTTASSLAGPLAATYGLYRAWRWFRD
jgi:5'-deoxynucleotidase YfbR-like HD superfamily hydrolase